MPSQIEGFEYDIFISYRQNDNRPAQGTVEQHRSGWVTDFVKALESELASTIKEPVSVYFDSSPKDGLLETHNVDKSLEGKLRCLIFIPIVSQTYCDPKGFAWQHEFVAFNKAAIESKLGRDIKLDGGNVACRILPVRIHDLDSDDKAMIEREMGSALRSIDFIYKEPGVNRPLTPDDNAEVNLNKTRYKNQVNKVANAIKELLHGLHHVGERRGPLPAPDRTSVPSGASRKSLRLVYASLALVITIALGYWVFNILATTSSTGGLEKSIAVLPFANLSKDPEQEYFSDGITDQIITNLSHLRDVKVIARTSVLKYKGTTASISDIRSDLNVNYVLEGSVQKSGNQLRINAQLIRTNDNSHAWAEIFNRKMTDIFAVQDDISQSIAKALGNTLRSEELDKDRPANTEAYDTYLRAKHIAFTQYNWHGHDNIAEAFNNAKSLYEKAIQLDPGFAPAYAGLADLYDELRNHDRTAFPKELDMLRISLARKAFKLDPNSGFVNNVYAFVIFNSADSANYDSAHYYLKRAHFLDPGDSYLTWCLGQFYGARGLQEEALPYLTKARDENPNDPKTRSVLGMTLYNLGRTEEAKAEFEKAIRTGEAAYFGNEFTILWLLTEHQADRAAKISEAPAYVNNLYIKSLLSAVEGNMEAIRPDLVRPIHFLLRGMPAEALRRVDDNSRSKVWNPYNSMKNAPVWASARNLPDYPRVLEKARLANEVAKKRYGF